MKADPRYLMWLGDFVSDQPFESLAVYRAELVFIGLLVNAKHSLGDTLSNRSLVAACSRNGVKALLSRKPGKGVKLLLKPMLKQPNTDFLLADLKARLQSKTAPSLAAYMARELEEVHTEAVEQTLRAGLSAIEQSLLPIPNLNLEEATQPLSKTGT
jgi:hypothetical protein